MPPLKIQCAECDTWLKIPELPEHGKVRCPKCSATIKVQVVGRARPADDEDDDEDEAPRRPRKRRAAAARRPAAAGFNWGLILAVVGGGIVAGAIFLRYIFVNTQPVMDWEQQEKGGSSQLHRPADQQDWLRAIADTTRWS